MIQISFDGLRYFDEQGRTWMLEKGAVDALRGPHASEAVFQRVDGTLVKTGSSVYCRQWAL